MSTNTINILFIADIVGKAGYDIAAAHINVLKDRHHVHLTIANGENGAGGKGITKSVAKSYFDMGIDVITSGNHIWNRFNFYPTLDEQPRILRPLNYPPECPGHGSCIIHVSEADTDIGVINLQGRSFMYNIDCPFRTADAEIERLKNSGVQIVFIDFHAEATAEKIALGWHLDGRVSAVVGTHTHVQTADERILPKGTAYITDAGMSGAFDSVIGMDTDVAIKRFLTQLPSHYKEAGNNPMLCGVVLSVDTATARATAIRRFQMAG